MSEMVRYRRWHPTHGAGTYVSNSGELDGTFEADSGLVLPLKGVNEMGIGRPGKRLPKNRRHEDWQWTWMRLASGEVFVYRDSPPDGWPAAVTS